MYEGVPVNKMEQYELSRKIGTVFQDPRSQFFAVNTTDEVAFGCENLAFSTERINQNVDAAFSRMNIDVLRDRSLFGLSSGEKQRLAVASIYAMDTDVIVLDEPTANLDGETIQNLRELLFTLKAEGKLSLFLNTAFPGLEELPTDMYICAKGELKNMGCGGGCLPFARCAARIRFTQHTKCAFSYKENSCKV